MIVRLRLWPPKRGFAAEDPNLSQTKESVDASLKHISSFDKMYSSQVEIVNTTPLSPHTRCFLFKLTRSFHFYSVLIMIWCHCWLIGQFFVYRLTVFDGIQSSILNYEKGAMLCVDISHKVMRTDTVADLMRSCRMHVGSSGWKETIMKRLLGKIVLTR